MANDNEIAKKIAELPTLTTKELRAKWIELYGKEPPRFNRQFLIKKLAHRIQELAYGGLSQEVKDRMNALLDEEGYNELGVKTKKRRTVKPLSGTVFMREWNNEKHVVKALDSGFEYKEVVYNSLSSVARAITGSRWNGPAFFGLRNKRGNSLTESGDD